MTETQDEQGLDQVLSGMRGRDLVLHDRLTAQLDAIDRQIAAGLNANRWALGIAVGAWFAWLGAALVTLI